jgi:hypothetical protein
MSTYWLEVREARDVALFILGALREESLYVSCRGADCSSSQVVALKHVINVSDPSLYHGRRLGNYKLFDRRLCNCSY